MVNRRGAERSSALRLCPEPILFELLNSHLCNIAKAHPSKRLGKCLSSKFVMTPRPLVGLRRRQINLVDELREVLGAKLPAIPAFVNFQAFLKLNLLRLFPISCSGNRAFVASALNGEVIIPTGHSALTLLCRVLFILK